MSNSSVTHACLTPAPSLIDLQRKSASSDSERFAIVHMKSMCGHQYTEKLEQMCQDLALSDDASKVRMAAVCDMPSCCTWIWRGVCVWGGG